MKIYATRREAYRAHRVPGRFDEPARDAFEAFLVSQRIKFRRAVGTYWLRATGAALGPGQWLVVLRRGETVILTDEVFHSLFLEVIK